MHLSVFDLAEHLTLNFALRFCLLTAPRQAMVPGQEVRILGLWLQHFDQLK